MLGGPNSDTAVGHQKCWYINMVLHYLCIERYYCPKIMKFTVVGKDSFTVDASLSCNEFFFNFCLIMDVTCCHHYLSYLNFVEHFSDTLSM